MTNSCNFTINFILLFFLICKSNFNFSPIYLQSCATLIPYTLGAFEKDQVQLPCDLLMALRESFTISTLANTDPRKKKKYVHKILFSLLLFAFSTAAAAACVWLQGNNLDASAG